MPINTRHAMAMSPLLPASTRRHGTAESIWLLVFSDREVPSDMENAARLLLLLVLPALSASRQEQPILRADLTAAAK
jgi:hypothetical protein